jgi:hypothetical protein
MFLSKKADLDEICRLACSQAMNARGWRNFMRRRLAMQKVDPVKINCHDLGFNFGAAL